ncbi:MAG: M28 family peptidase [Candidatus Aminicenantaceae bacterium]
MRVILSLLIAFLLMGSPVFSASSAKAKAVVFDARAAWSYIKDLASDSMQGRRSGQPGAAMAEDYIASKFKEWGLEPAGDEGTYFQNFTIDHVNIEEGVVFEVIAGKERRNFYYEDDWRVQKYSGSGNFTAEVVFVGYGIHAPEKKYDDYDGVDVKGKLVLFTTETPTRLEEKFKDEAEIENRVTAAQKLGARGVLFFKSPTSQRRYFRIRLKKEVYKPDFVILSVEDRVTNFIFKDLETDLRYLLQQIRQTSNSMSYETKVKAFVAVNTLFDEKRPSRNVLAKITGSDRVIMDECVVIGAHMDHLGISPLGEFMNGANDNASGTAVVMEIARIMKLNRSQPKRTVIFALWAGEEQGLLGSEYYVDHPVCPIEKTIAYINMDMVGHGSGKVNLRGTYYGPEVWKLLKEKLPEEILNYVSPGRGGPGGSDHTPFLQKGVPGFAIMTDGFHFKYHRSRDDIDLIKPALLKKTGDFVHKAVEIIASEIGDFIPPLRRETYYLKLQNLINFEMSPLKKFTEHHKDAKDSHVDLQLTLVEEKEELDGDALRIEVLKNIMVASEKLRKAKGLSYYSSADRLSRDVRQGKTTVIPGLRGIRSIQDDPGWAEVLAKQGVFYVFMDSPSFLFTEEGLSEEGKKIVKALNESGILLIVSGIDSSQGKVLLETSKKPLIVLQKNLPDGKVLELIRKKKAALGLILSKEEEAGVYFKKLDEVKKAIGTEHLLIVNEECLWEKKGKEHMLQVIAEILKAEYERQNISNIFSSTFLRVLRNNRGEESPSPFAFIPF